MFDKFREECGLIGIWNVPEAANLSYLGLYAQQHRGQEGAGVVSLKQDTREFATYKGLGLVSDVFEDYDFSSLPGDAAIGHVRYTTAGSNMLANVQPFCSEIATGKIAIAHNGNLTNAEALKARLIQSGSIFHTSSDTEAIVHLLAKGGDTLSRTQIIINAVKEIRGAYSLIILTDKAMFLVRDPNGFRPLSIGKLDDGYVAASETCAFDLIGAEYIRDVEPGEILRIGNDNKLSSYYPFGVSKQTPCIFEYVYFSRPDSFVFGRNVHKVRKSLGVELAKESFVPADMVIAVPDSGVPAAMGFAAEAKIPFEYGLIRNHYVGRTFIEPKQSIRDFGVKVKLNPNKELLRGQRVIVVDDSLVRGTTSKKLVSMIRAAGAKEVHMRISAPPTRDPCYYGVDTPDKDQLIASNKNLEEIRAHIAVDSLAYLSIEGMYRAADAAKNSYCDACFTGNYPVEIAHLRKSRQEQLFS